jgi:iron-sulfur cluster repair protein YtfE (RIC family)
MIYAIKKFLRYKKTASYQDKLIKELMQDHRQLLDFIPQIESAAREDNLEKFRKLLNAFYKELDLHLLYEDTHLYEYLKWKYSFFDEARDMIKDKQAEMDKIAREIKEFISIYKKKSDLTNFLEDFKRIQEVLLKRIEFEEKTLYDIYNNSYDWKEVVEKLSFSQNKTDSNSIEVKSV